MKINDLILDKNKIYFLSPFSMGDTLILCGLHDELEKKYKCEIVLLIKPEHELIMKLCEKTCYKIVEFDDKNIETLRKESDKCPYPRKGGIFVAHGDCHLEILDFNERSCWGKYNFLPYFLRFFDLNPETKLTLPNFTININNDLRNKLTSIAPLNKIVLFMPEARSIENINIKEWERIAQDLKDKGFTVISGALKQNNAIKNTIFMRLSLEESLQIAYNCHSVYSLRSGFSDLCYQLGRKLTVLYSSYKTFYLFNLKTIFNRNDINEIIIPKYQKKGQKINKITFLGIPILSLKYCESKTYVKLFGIQLIKILRGIHE